MELCKRIRVVFKDNDILSESQKLEGFSRSWVLLEPHRHDAVSDLASHLLHAFHLHQSCPHGLLLSISGFVLPPFESTSILKDNEIISVRKRKDILSIAGNIAANDVQKLKALEKQPVEGGVLLLANDEFEKEKGGYESDESEKEPEDDDKVLLEVVEKSSGGHSNKKNRKRKAVESEDDDSSGGNSKKKNRKRKAAERLQGNKEKKQRAEVTENPSSDVCKEKKDASVAGDNVENEDEPAKHSDENGVPGEGVKRTVDAQEKDSETDDDKIAPKETKKGPSRSARRKTKKRQWLREMAKIQKQNAICESEGLRNWKADQAKNGRKITDGQLKAREKWKKYQADDEGNKVDGQPKGLLHWKLSSQNNGLVKGKKHKRHNQNDGFLELPNQNGDVSKQQNQNGDVCKQKNQNSNVRKQQTQNGDVRKQQNQNGDKGQLTGMGDTLEEPNHSLHEEPGQSSPSVEEYTNQKIDASMQSNHKTAEENEFVPIEIRPGHIRFEPLEEEEAVQQHHAPVETFNWNGITSKKKGQQWGKENRRFTPRNDYTTNKEDCETSIKEKEKRQPNERINFDKLLPLPGSPKEGDLIAYRVLELSSTWTPELSSHRVGKVSWYNAESNQTMLLPVPEYPIVSEEDDEDEAAQLDNSLYKEDGSLEIDFSSLIDVRVLTNGRLEPGNKAVTYVNEASTGNANALETALPGSSGKPTADPSPDTREPNQGKGTQPPSGDIDGSVWDQLSEALNAKKEQLAKENGWGSTPKKVVVSHENSWGKDAKKLHSSPGSNWGKNTQKPKPSQEYSWGKQTSGSKSWSYKALRGSALGPTMAMLRSKRDT